MNLIQRLRRILAAKKAKPAETPDPYVNARRAFNDHTGAVMRERDVARLLALLAAMVALVLAGGIVYDRGTSRYVPYIVAVDKLGQAAAVGVAERAAVPDDRMIKAALHTWIRNARTVTMDGRLQRDMIVALYSMIAAGDAARGKMDEYLSGNPPFKRAATELVSLDEVLVLQQTDVSWEATWQEVTRDRKGVVVKRERWRALLTIAHAPPNRDATEADIRLNPASVFVRDYSWSKYQ